MTLCGNVCVDLTIDTYNCAECGNDSLLEVVCGNNDPLSGCFCADVADVAGGNPVRPASKYS